MNSGVDVSKMVPGTFIGSIEDIPWQEVPDRDGQVRIKFFGENNETGPWVLLTWFAPGYSEPHHWHDHDTIYIPTRGSMIIGEEGVLGVGDIRWVRAGTYYGPEAAGDEGCEFWLIAYGEPGYHRQPPAQVDCS